MKMKMFIEIFVTVTMLSSLALAGDTTNTDTTNKGGKDANVSGMEKPMGTSNMGKFKNEDSMKTNGSNAADSNRGLQEEILQKIKTTEGLIDTFPKFLQFLNENEFKNKLNPDETQSLFEKSLSIQKVKRSASIMTKPDFRPYPPVGPIMPEETWKPILEVEYDIEHPTDPVPIIMGPDEEPDLVTYVSQYLPSYELLSLVFPKDVLSIIANEMTHDQLQMLCQIFIGIIKEGEQNSIIIMPPHPIFPPGGPFQPPGGPFQPPGGPFQPPEGPFQPPVYPPFFPFNRRDSKMRPKMSRMSPIPYPFGATKNPDFTQNRHHNMFKDFHRFVPQEAK